MEASRSTGFRALDRLLAGGGLRSGSLVEWRGERDGSGAKTLAFAVAANLLRDDGALVVIDDERNFYPVGVAGLGVPLDRTIIVRADTEEAGQWAWEQALRTPGVTVTLGRLEKVSDKVARRLQLASEAGGVLGFLIRPPDAPSATWAATRLIMEGMAGSGNTPGWRLRVRVTRGQTGPRESVAEVELGHEASALPVATELARPVAKRRPTTRRAAGPARRVRPGPG